MEETSKQVRKLSHLARLSLTPEEERELAGRLEQMVGYLQALSQVEEGEAAEVPSAVPSAPMGWSPPWTGTSCWKTPHRCGTGMW